MSVHRWVLDGARAPVRVPRVGWRQVRFTWVQPRVLDKQALLKLKELRPVPPPGPRVSLALIPHCVLRATSPRTSSLLTFSPRAPHSMGSARRLGRAGPPNAGILRQ